MLKKNSKIQPKLRLKKTFSFVWSEDADKIMQLILPLSEGQLQTNILNLKLPFNFLCFKLTKL